MLVKCQNCSATVSHAAEACPKCRARGDAVFGPLLNCSECGVPGRVSMTSCKNCGAPSDVAFKAPVERGATVAEQPLPSQAQSKTGFAQGGFGKAASWLLFVVGVFATFGVVRNWVTYPESTQSPAYMFGTFIGLAAIVGGAWRAIVKRRSRRVLDWICGAYLIFMSIVTGLGAFAGLTRADLPDNTAAIIAGAISVVVSATSLIVAIRLMRRPARAHDSPAHLAETFE